MCSSYLCSDWIRFVCINLHVFHPLIVFIHVGILKWATFVHVTGVPYTWKPFTVCPFIDFLLGRCFCWFPLKVEKQTHKNAHVLLVSNFTQTWEPAKYNKWHAWAFWFWLEDGGWGKWNRQLYCPNSVLYFCPTAIKPWLW